MDKLSGRNVFFCYSQKDEELKNIKYLLNFFSDIDLNVLNINEKDKLIHSNEISSTLSKYLSRGDYLIIALTKNSVNSKWMIDLLSDLEFRYRSRDINIISLKMDECSVPDLLFNDFFVDYTNINGLEQLVQILRYSYLIDFKEFNYQSFENLIYDLLKCLGFKNLEREFPMLFSREYNDYENNINFIISNKPLEALKSSTFNEEYVIRFDFKGEFSQKDPFGLIEKSLWIIDVKFKRNKIDPGFIKQVGKYVSKLPEKYQLVIITSGHLTSTSRESINKIQENSRVKIKIIDGSRLRKILVQNPSVVERHF